MIQQHPLTRRHMLAASAAALSGWAGAFPRINPLWAGDAAPHPLAPREPHFPARAQRVIFFFMTGGVSHVDSFDPKPKLNADHDQDSVRKGRKWKASLWKHAPRGQSGIEVSELFPHLAERVDDLCLIRSMHGDHGDHFEATLGIHTGSDGSAMPSLGAWVSYGLGTRNPNLPSYVVFAKHKPYAGAQVWDSNFLPAYHQGVRVLPGSEPIPNLRPHAETAALQDRELQMLARLNQRHLELRPEDQQLAARNLSFQTARSLQNVAPEVFDMRQESDATLQLYGLQGRGDNESFGWQCLMARRMAERGVRFIELIDTGSGRNWDAHGDMETHRPLAKAVDQPIAGLLADLKSRGLLDDTLVVWCTEFGRTPFHDSNPKGRGHWKNVFTCWMAGGGVKGGHVYGASDEYGLEVAENGVHTHDFHALILHLLGLDHQRLTYHYSGRDFRLTDVHGHVPQDILA